jgi:YggT family protein
MPNGAVFASAAIYEPDRRGVKGTHDRRRGARRSCPVRAAGLHVCRTRPESGLRFEPQSSPEQAMRALLEVILLALNIYIWIVIAAAILSWLVAFNVVNTRNQFVATIGEFLYRITEPALRPIRSMLPNFGGIDISPIVLFLIIILIEKIIVLYIYPYVP